MIIYGDIQRLKEKFLINEDSIIYLQRIIKRSKAKDQAERKVRRRYFQTLTKEISSILTDHEGRIKDLEKQSFSTN